jgi:hypothetical protein
MIINIFIMFLMLQTLIFDDADVEFRWQMMFLDVADVRAPPPERSVPSGCSDASNTQTLMHQIPSKMHVWNQF